MSGVIAEAAQSAPVGVYRFADFGDNLIIDSLARFATSAAAGCLGAGLMALNSWLYSKTLSWQVAPPDGVLQFMAVMLSAVAMTILPAGLRFLMLRSIGARPRMFWAFLGLWWTILIDVTAQNRLTVSQFRRAARCDVVGWLVPLGVSLLPLGNIAAVAGFIAAVHLYRVLRRGLELRWMSRYSAGTLFRETSLSVVYAFAPAGESAGSGQ